MMSAPSCLGCNFHISCGSFRFASPNTPEQKCQLNLPCNIHDLCLGYLWISIKKSKNTRKILKHIKPSYRTHESSINPCLPQNIHKSSPLNLCHRVTTRDRGGIASALATGEVLPLVRKGLVHRSPGMKEPWCICWSWRWYRRVWNVWWTNIGLWQLHRNLGI